MDRERFDGFARVLAHTTTRRGAAGGLAGLAALALAGPGSVVAKHKKKKGQRCMRLRQSCRSGSCCGGLTCDNNGCDGGPACYQREGASCDRACDCAGEMGCSHRFGDTCQYCSYPQTECLWTDECCTNESICGLNGCNHTSAVCCQWEIGSFCYEDCDCCEELGCFGNACLPLLTVDGSPRRKDIAGEAAQKGPVNGPWPRREGDAGERRSR